MSASVPISAEDLEALERRLEENTAEYERISISREGLKRALDQLIGHGMPLPDKIVSPYNEKSKRMLEIADEDADILEKIRTTQDQLELLRKAS